MWVKDCTRTNRDAVPPATRATAGCKELLYDWTVAIGVNPESVALCPFREVYSIRQTGEVIACYIQSVTLVQHSEEFSKVKRSIKAPSDNLALPCILTISKTRR